MTANVHTQNCRNFRTPLIPPTVPKARSTISHREARMDCGTPPCIEAPLLVLDFEHTMPEGNPQVSVPEVPPETPQPIDASNRNHFRVALTSPKTRPDDMKQELASLPRVELVWRMNIAGLRVTGERRLELVERALRYECIRRGVPGAPWYSDTDMAPYPLSTSALVNTLDDDYFRIALASPTTQPDHIAKELESLPHTDLLALMTSAGIQTIAEDRSELLDRALRYECIRRGIPGAPWDVASDFLHRPQTAIDEVASLGRSPPPIQPGTPKRTLSPMELTETAPSALPAPLLRTLSPMELTDIAPSTLPSPLLVAKTPSQDGHLPEGRTTAVTPSWDGQMSSHAGGETTATSITMSKDATTEQDVPDLIDLSTPEDSVSIEENNREGLKGVISTTRSPVMTTIDTESNSPDDSLEASTAMSLSELGGLILSLAASTQATPEMSNPGAENGHDGAPHETGCSDADQPQVHIAPTADAPPVTHYDDHFTATEGHLGQSTAIIEQAYPEECPDGSADDLYSLEDGFESDSRSVTPPPQELCTETVHQYSANQQLPHVHNRKVNVSSPRSFTPGSKGHSQSCQPPDNGHVGEGDWTAETTITAAPEEGQNPESDTHHADSEEVVTVTTESMQGRTEVAEIESIATDDSPSSPQANQNQENFLQSRH